MKIYTGTGDSGKTSLFSGERIAKNDDRIEAYGTIDELNSIIGAIAAALPSVSEAEAVKDKIFRIQSDLFRVGAMLATTADSTACAYLHPIGKKDFRWLEEQVDQIQLQLPELKAFILPGGHTSASWSHVARTVCRRSERRITALLGKNHLPEDSIICLLTYINRLSDFFFVLARYCNKLAGVEDQVLHK